MNCPVCNTIDLSDDTTMCPHCQSDLEVFQLIVRAGEQRQTSKKIISALGLFAAVTAIGWASVGIFSGKTSEPTTPAAELSPEVTIQGESRPAPNDAEMMVLLKKENETLKSENASLAAKLNAVNTKSISKESSATESGTIIHTVKKNETLWIIARKYFKDGRKYKQIAADNGISTKKKLKLGMKLKIQK